MQVKYSNFRLDDKIYNTNELSGIYDEDGTFLDSTIYDIRTLIYNKNMPVMWFLKLGSQKERKKFIPEFLDEFEISKELQKRKLGTLSESELLKVLIIKVCVSEARVVILDSIDSVLNWKDLNTVLKKMRSHAKASGQNILFTTNKLDNMVNHSDKYIIVKDNKITYNNKDFSAMPELTETGKFAEMANKRGADLHKYKDPSDLLKAIYRDVKRR